MRHPGVLSRKPFFTALLLLVLLLMALAYVSTLYENRLYSEKRLTAQTLLYSRGRRLNEALQERILLLHSVQAFIHSGSSGGSPEDLCAQFRLFAEGLLISKPEIRALQVFPPQGPMFLYPVEGNEEVQNRRLEDLINDERPAVREAVAETIRTGTIVLSEPYELRQGGLGLVARRALFYQGALWGIASVVIDLPPLFEMAEISLDTRELHYHLVDHQQNFIIGTKSHFINPLEYKIILPGQTWTLTAEPKEGWQSTYRYSLRLFRILGVILSVFAAAMVYILLTQRGKLEKQVHKQTEEIRESESLLKEAQAIARFGSWQMDVAAGTITCSEEVFRILGIENGQADFSYQTFLSLLHPADREAVDTEFSRTLREGDAVFEEQCRILGTGSHRKVIIRCDIHRNIRGKAVKAIGIIQDITDQTAASAERDRLASAIEQIDEMVVILDLDRTICYVNPAFERITGFSRDEALGKSADILKSGAHTEQFYTAVWHTLHRGESWTGRFINRKKDGTLYTDETTITPILNSRGRVTNYVEIKRDITSELEMRERLSQSDKEESLGRLAGGIAHDLNNLLSPILGYSEILSTREEIPASLIKMIQNIHQAGIKSRNLVRQLLAFSRKQALNFLALDLEKTVKDFEPFLKRVIREDVVIRVDSQPALPPVRADKGQIEQVLMNLAVNAQDAMPDGGILSINLELTTVESRPEKGVHEADPGTYLKLSVRDTGTGMDDDTRKRIFEPFFSTKGAQGTGLGLATVYGIIKQHAGTITLETCPGAGTIFTILLPVAEKTTPKSADSGFKAGAMERGSETVLVAEDSAQVLDLTRTIREQSGYTVFTAPSGEEALKVLKKEKNRIDLLLTDVIMPKMNGPELFRQALEICPDLKVLYMSGYTGNAILQHGFSEKEVHLIQKPFTLASLTHKVREVLDSR